MQQIPIPFGTGVRVTWLDSKALDGWNPTKLGLREPDTIVSLGQVTRNTEDGLTISTSIGLDGHLSIDDLTIPWAAVKYLDMNPFGYDYEGASV